MKYIVKKHVSHEGKIIVVICDVDLIGKKIEGGELQLDLTSNFYKGDKLDDEEVEAVVKDAHVLNIVGEDSIKFVLDKKFIKKENILNIKNVPYAQALIIRE